MQRVGEPTWAPTATLTALATPTRVKLTWPDANGAAPVEFYRVFRGGTEIGTVSKSPYTDTTIALSTMYTYTVGAVDTGGVETPSAERLSVNVTTPGASNPPAWPSGAALTAPRFGRSRVEIAWPAATDDHGEIRYELQYRVAGTGSWTTAVTFEGEPGVASSYVVGGLAAGTGYEFQVLLEDFEGHAASPVLAGLTVTTLAANTSPSWPTGAALTATATTRSSVELTWVEASIDVVSYEVERDRGSGYEAWASVWGTSWWGGGFVPKTAPYLFRVRGVTDDGATTGWLDTTLTISVPPEPSPPPFATSEATGFGDGVAFLYTAGGSTLPQQTGVDPATIVSQHASVLRGVVRRRASGARAPEPGVHVRVVDHPEYGETYTRDDGRFEMVVNGGGTLRAEFTKEGCLPVQRTVEPRWGEYALVDDVLLTAEAAPVALAVDATTGEVPTGGLGVHGPVVAGGTTAERRAAVYFPEGTTLTACLPGSTATTCEAQALTGNLHVALTEYTVADDEVDAMPGALPPSSEYTYAVACRVQEAEALGAVRVEFNQPVVAYVDNFLHLTKEGTTQEAGYAVPMGWYDRVAGRWVPNEETPGWTENGSGRAIQIVGVTGGLADVDVTGEGTADANTLGLSDEERAWLATSYPGPYPRRLWRVPIRHFTDWDANMGTRPEAGAKVPKVMQAKLQAIDGASVVCNSVIECENRALGETIPLPGTGLSLNYRNDRAPSWRTAIAIPVTSEFSAGATNLPRAVVVTVDVAGKRYTQWVNRNGETPRAAAGVEFTFARCAQSPPENDFCWDGRDAFGRVVRGSAVVGIRIGYYYLSEYGGTSSFGYNGGRAGAITVATGGGPSRPQYLVLWGGSLAMFPQWDGRFQGLGGWSLDAHHAWDVGGSRVLLGGGGSFAAEAAQHAWAVHEAGDESFSLEAPSVEDGMLALEANAPSYGRRQFVPRALAVDARGEVHVALDDTRVMRVDAEGRLRTVVELGATRGHPRGMTFGPDGSLYVSTVGDYDYRTEGFRVGRVWRVQGGVVTLFAGTGAEGPTSGTPAPAPATTLPLAGAADVAAAPDGAVYIAEPAGGRIRRVAPDGVMTVFAGNGDAAGAGCHLQSGAADVDDVVAAATWLCLPQGLGLGPDGSLWLTEYFKVSRITPDGRLHRVAGTGRDPRPGRYWLPSCDEGGGGLPADDGPALAACLHVPVDVAVLPSGDVVVSTSEQGALFAIGTDGRLNRFGAGEPYTGPRIAVRRPVTDRWATGPRDLALDPRGQLHVLSEGSHAVWRVESSVPGDVLSTEVRIPSPDGSEAYVFTAAGRHVRTESTVTGETLLTFGYAGDRLTSITDRQNARVSIAYGAGTFTITGPDGASVSGTLNGDGWLASVDAGDWGTHTLNYEDARGLLRSMLDARGDWHRYAYGADGRFDHDAWADSATTNTSGGRVVSLHGGAPSRTPTSYTRTVTTRDGTSTASGLDTVHTVVEYEDGHETRTHTPPVGPSSTTERSTRLGEQTRPGGTPSVWATVGRTVETGAGGAAWARSEAWQLPVNEASPLRASGRVDVRLGAGTGALRLATATRRTVVPDTAAEVRQATTVTDTVDAVAPLSSDAENPLLNAPTPLAQGGVPLRWQTVMSRASTTSPWTITRTSPMGRQTVTELDGRGRVVSVTSPPITQDGMAQAIAPVVLAYEPDRDPMDPADPNRGRLSTVTQGTRRTTHSYTGALVAAQYRGLPASVTVGTTSSGGPTMSTAWSYGDDGARTTRATLPGGRELRSATDVAGNVTSLTPPGRTAHAFAYGRRNRLATYTPPLPSGTDPAPWRTTYSHHVQGMPEQVARPDGDFDYTYTSGRLASVTLPAPSGGGTRPTVTYGYDDGATAMGVLTSLTHSTNGTLTYGYDRDATGTLPRSETWSVTEGGTTTTRSVAWTYDALARMGSWTAEGGPTLSVSYDADGLVTGVGDLAITRDPTAGVELGTSITAGSGTVTTTQRYNGYAEVTTRGSAYPEAMAGLSFAYGYDDFGRLVHVTESGEGAGEDRWYQYDSAGRLWKVCATEACGSGDLREQYTYDANGNRTAWTNGAGGFTVGSSDVDAQDRLRRVANDDGTSTTYDYDLHGRLTTRRRYDASETLTESTTLGYDGDGALRSFVRTGSDPVTVTYDVDAMGRRIARRVGGTATARWTYRDIHPVAEYDAAWALRRVFVYATRGHVPDYVLNDESGAWVLYRVVTDHLGSVRRVVRVSDGTVVQRMRYDGYGRVPDAASDWAASGWERLPFGYAGGVYDRATGLVRFGARDYDPEVGRWTAKDPSRFGGDDSNLYAYCWNRPIALADVDGEHPLVLLGALIEVSVFVAVVYGVTYFASDHVASGGLISLAPIATHIAPDSRRTSGPYGPEVHVYSSGLAFGNVGMAWGRVIAFSDNRSTVEAHPEWVTHERSHIGQWRVMRPLYLPLQGAAKLFTWGNPKYDPLEWGPWHSVMRARLIWTPGSPGG